MRRGLEKHFISNTCMRLFFSGGLGYIKEDEYCECTVELNLDLEADVFAHPEDV